MPLLPPDVSCLSRTGWCSTSFIAGTPLTSSFIKKYPTTIAWRLKKHCEVIEGYLNPNEEVLYAFCGQKNTDWWDIFTTCVVVLTNKRILIGQKRVVWGSFYNQITPDLYNDISNLAKSALDEIETHISEYMIEAKKEYKRSE